MLQYIPKGNLYFKNGYSRAKLRFLWYELLTRHGECLGFFIRPGFCELQNVSETHITHTASFFAENVKDILRERNGLRFISNLLTSGTDMSVKEAAMFSLGCAVESNGKELSERVKLHDFRL